MIDDHRLRIFCSVVNLKSFSDAAHHLHLSQSAVSTHIRKLESWIGFPLIDRHKRPVVPTELGNLLYLAAKDVLNRIQDIEALFLDIRKGIRGQVVVSTYLVLPSLILPTLILEFHTLYPQITLRFHQRRYGEVLENVNDSTSHFGLLLSDSQPLDFETEELFPVDFVLVHRPSKRRSRSRPPTHALIMEKGFVLPSKEARFTKILEKKLRDQGFDYFPVRFEVGSWEAVMSTVLCGLGIGILPKTLIANELATKCLEEIRISGPLRANVYLIRKTTRYATPAMEMFQKFVFKELPICFGGSWHREVLGTSGESQSRRIKE